MGYFKTLFRSLIVALLVLNAAGLYGATFPPTYSNRVVGMVISSTHNEIVLKTDNNVSGTKNIRINIGPHSRIVFEDPMSRPVLNENATVIRPGKYVEATYTDADGKLTADLLRVLKSVQVSKNSTPTERGTAALGQGRNNAEIKICNEYPRLISAAVGFLENGMIKTQGWWDIHPGQCVVVDHYSLDGPYYLHARSLPSVNREDSTVKYTLWGDDRSLAVQIGNNFALDHADKLLPRTVPTKFMSIGQQEDVSAVTLTIKANGHASVKTTVAPTIPTAFSEQKKIATDPREEEKEKKEFLQALNEGAEKGEPTLQYFYGSYMLTNGGDLKVGAAWVRKAADQGLAMAQNLLAECYLTGAGVIKDPKTAAFWYRKAGAGGDESALKWLKQHPKEAAEK